MDEVDGLQSTLGTTYTPFELFRAALRHERKELDGEPMADIVGAWEPGLLESMSKLEAKEFRCLAARLNYLSQDCPDLQFAAKEVARHMSRPTIFISSREEFLTSATSIWRGNNGVPTKPGRIRFVSTWMT